MDLLTRFDGRISRKGFWLGFLAVIAISLIFGFGLQAALTRGVLLKLGQVIVAAGIIYLWSAVLVKRLHDRGKPALPWVAIFLAPGVLMQFMSIFEIGYSVAEFGGTQVLVPGIAVTVVMWFATGIALWMLIELGFLKGVSGPNAYGTDPLGEATEPQAA